VKTNNTEKLLTIQKLSQDEILSETS